jgi:hypothetical protein
VRTVRGISKEHQMSVQVTRDSRAWLALAIASVGLSACSSGPTAPSSLSGGDAARGAVAASAPAASAGSGEAQINGADTIKITRGTLAVEARRTGTVTLRGSHGFRFEGRTLTGGVDPSSACGAFGPCQPGETVAFRAVWLGTDIPGTARVQGDDFTIQGNDGTSMFIELTGSFVAPAHLTDSASVTVPFTAVGRLFRGGTYPPFELTGGGQVTLTLEWDPFLGGWAITHSSFDFGNGPAD